MSWEVVVLLLFGPFVIIGVWECVDMIRDTARPRLWCSCGQVHLYAVGVRARTPDDVMHEESRCQPRREVL